MVETSPATPYGVLVLHGLTSSLASVTPVADRLARHSIPTVVPWLRGHGTRPEDLVGVTWRDWYADAVLDAVEEFVLAHRPPAAAEAPQVAARPTPGS